MSALEFSSYLCIAIVLVVPSLCKRFDRGEFRSQVTGLGQWFIRVLNAAQSSPMTNINVPGAFPVDFVAINVAESFDDLHEFPLQRPIKVTVAELAVEIVMDLIMVCCAVPVFLTGLLSMLLSVLVLVQAAREAVVDITYIFLKAASQAGIKAVRDHYTVADSRVITSLTEVSVEKASSPTQALAPYRTDDQSGSDHTVKITVFFAPGMTGRIAAGTSFEVTIGAASLFKNVMAFVGPKTFAIHTLMPRYYPVGHVSTLLPGLDDISCLIPLSKPTVPNFLAQLSRQDNVVDAPEAQTISNGKRYIHGPSTSKCIIQSDISLVKSMIVTDHPVRHIRLTRLIETSKPKQSMKPRDQLYNSAHDHDSQPSQKDVLATLGEKAVGANQPTRTNAAPTLPNASSRSNNGALLDNVPSVIEHEGGAPKSSVEIIRAHWDSWLNSEMLQSRKSARVLLLTARHGCREEICALWKERDYDDDTYDADFPDCTDEYLAWAIEEAMASDD